MFFCVKKASGDDNFHLPQDQQQETRERDQRHQEPLRQKL